MRLRTNPKANEILENNKELLPIETYNNAQKDLKHIGNEMINCDVKR